MILWAAMLTVASAEAAPPNADPSDRSTAEIAAWLGGEPCLDFLTGDLMLSNNANLINLGFGSATSPSESTRFGTMQLLSASYSNGGIAFGGIADKICVVAVNGPAASEAISKLRSTKDTLGFSFEPFETNTPSNMKVETYRARIDDRITFYAQIADARDTPQAVVTYQLFSTIE